MKKLITLLIILSLLTLSGCKWFSGQTETEENEVMTPKQETTALTEEESNDEYDINLDNALNELDLVE